MSSPSFVFRHFHKRFDLLIALILNLLYLTFPDCHVMRVRGTTDRPWVGGPQGRAGAVFLDGDVYKGGRWLLQQRPLESCAPHGR